MDIRLANTTDRKAVNCLFDAFFRYLADLQPNFCFPAKSDGSYFQKILGSADDVLFVAEIDAAVIGILHLTISKTPAYPSVVQHCYGEIVDFFVTESLRGRGVGRALMQAAKNWCSEKDLDYLELFVLENAESERRFYEKSGFETAHRTMRYMLY